MSREAGVLERHDRVIRATKQLRSRVLAALIALSVIIVSLHAVGGLFLLKIGLDGFSLPNPIVAVLVGLSVLVAVLKLAHVAGLVHRKEKSAGEDVRKG